MFFLGYLWLKIHTDFFIVLFILHFIVGGIKKVLNLIWTTMEVSCFKILRKPTSTQYARWHNAFQSVGQKELTFNWKQQTLFYFSLFYSMVKVASVSKKASKLIIAGYM